MSRRKLSERFIRKLFRTGRERTIGVTIPIEMIKDLGWKEKQKVILEKKGKFILIKDWTN